MKTSLATAIRAGLAALTLSACAPSEEQPHAIVKRLDADGRFTTAYSMGDQTTQTTLFTDGTTFTCYRTGDMSDSIYISPQRDAPLRIRRISPDTLEQQEFWRYERSCNGINADFAKHATTTKTETADSAYGRSWREVLQPPVEPQQ